MLFGGKMANQDEPSCGQIITTVTNGSLKGLISSIPVVGDMLLSGMDAYWNLRSEVFIKKLSDAIKNLSETKIDKAFIQSEEFFDLFHKAWRSYVQTRSREKARIILGLVEETVRVDRAAAFSVSRKELFLWILDLSFFTHFPHFFRDSSQRRTEQACA